MNSMMEWVAFGLSSLNAVVAPEAIIIGGGIVSDFMFYEHLVDRYFKGFSQNNQFAPSIVAAANGANAGAVGAALLTVYKDNL
jgi:predicted NBD/HSP70 family sugar kinase